MNRDRSLEEFLDAESGESDGAAGRGDEVDAETGAEVEQSSNLSVADANADVAGEERGTARSGDADPAAGLAARPARSTMDWTPDGADCEACGASAERRWRDGERLVCEACKGW
jgi:hypothetical protein